MAGGSSRPAPALDRWFATELVGLARTKFPEASASTTRGFPALVRPVLSQLLGDSAEGGAEKMDVGEDSGRLSGAGA